MEPQGRDTVSSVGEISVLHVDDDREFAEASATYLVNIDNNLDIVIETSAQDGLERLIDDLLALVRGGEEVVSEAPVDVGDIAERCWKTIETGEATLAVDTDRVISADADKLQQLLENLIQNSVEHGTTGGRSANGDEEESPGVTVTVGGLESGFYVADDGPGIPPAEREDVLDAGYSTSDDGTGFGLAIVEQVADLHDWTIEITEGDSSGARFEITGVDPAR